ncbi:MAG: carboxypeptidase-like regulatory domain-containing protein [Candidatus Sumerlaeota bacterium]|nr:carboxypeptidase-like regulatory domain-containing protein [Candidatus Sumerlaeota bacterium]
MSDAPVHDFPLEAAGDVDVLVVDEGGTPVAEVRLSVERCAGGETVEEGVTDENGCRRLQGISLLTPMPIHAEREGYYWRGGATAEFAPGQKRADLKITLRKVAEETAAGGVFAGRVTDPAGAAIAGATVQWGPKQALPREAAPTATTGDDGRYRFAVRGPGDGSYTLAAWGPGRAPVWKDTVLPGTEQAPTIVDYQLEPGHWLAGVVVDEEDKPLRGIQVRLIDKRDTVWTNRPVVNQDPILQTDAQGRLRCENLPGPEVGVEIFGEGRSQLTATVPVDQEARLVMKAMGVIRGRVLDDQSGEPVIGFRVCSANPNVISFPRSMGKPYSSREGRFILELDQGTAVDVSVEADGYAAETMEDIEPAPGDQAEERVFRLKRGEALNGKVVDALTGAPLARATVAWLTYAPYMPLEWEGSEQNSAMENRKSALTDDQGGFSFVEGSEKGALVFRCRDHERLLVKPEDRPNYMDETGALRIPLHAGASVTGVYYQNGRPAAGAEARLHLSSRSAGQEFGQVQTDASGRYSWDRLPPGRYEIHAGKRREGAGSSGLTRTFELGPGEQKVVNLGDESGLCALHGRVLNEGAPALGAEIDLKPVAPTDYVEFIDHAGQDGAYRIEGLPVGAYRAMAREGGGNHLIWESIEIKGDTEHDFILRQEHAVRARFAAPPGAPAGFIQKIEDASLRILDPALAPDENPEQIQSWLRGNVQSGRVRFQGRCKGPYSIELSGSFGGTETSSILIAGPFQLDNLNGDQDLGEIAIPPVGSIRFQIALDPSARNAPEYLTAILRPNGDERLQSSLSLRPGEADQVAGPVPLGDYETIIDATGFQADPPRTRVTVGPGEPPMVAASLRPEGSFEGYARVEYDPSGQLQKDLRLRRVTLAGPGGDRVLTASQANPDGPAPSSRWSSDDQVSGSSFDFHNLPGGAYDLAVEADGYEPWRRKIQVTPGAYNRQTIDLKRRSAQPGAS